MLADVGLVVGAYLLGSVPYMLLLARARGFDLSQEDDLHFALWRKVGRLEGLSGIIFDALKGAIPILIGFYLDFRLVVVISAGVAAVVGQMWPVFRKFDGEKGNTTGLAMFLTLTILYHAYLVLIIAAITILIGAGIKVIPRAVAPGQTASERFEFGGPESRSLPLGMAVGFAIMPLISWLIKQPLEMTLGLFALFVVIMVRRLTAGLSADLKTATSVGSILINRLLYDRSYL